MFKSEQTAEFTYPRWWKTGLFAFSSEYLPPPCSPQLLHRLSGSHILSSALILFVLLLSVLRDHWISLIFKIQQHFYCRLFSNLFKNLTNEWHCCPPPHYHVRHISSNQGCILSHKAEETLNILCRVTVDLSTVYLTSKWSSFCIVGLAFSSLEKMKCGYSRRQNNVHLIYSLHWAW